MKTTTGKKISDRRNVRLPHSTGYACSRLLYLPYTLYSPLVHNIPYILLVDPKGELRKVEHRHQRIPSRDKASA